MLYELCSSRPGKIFEKIIYNRFLPQTQVNIPIEQVSFMRGRSCCDQVVVLVTHIVSGFQNKNRSFVALLDLTAVYGTVWIELCFYYTFLKFDSWILKLL